MSWLDKETEKDILMGISRFRRLPGWVIRRGDRTKLLPKSSRACPFFLFPDSGQDPGAFVSHKGALRAVSGAQLSPKLAQRVQVLGFEHI